MPRYSEERCRAVVAKLLPPQSLSPQAVAEQEGLSLATVYKWRKEARAEGHCLPDANAQGSAQWSSKDRFAAVLETAALNAEETAEYCRRRGLYPEQLVAWRNDCEQAGSLTKQERKREAEEVNALYCGRRFRVLNVIDEGTREALEIVAIHHCLLRASFGSLSRSHPFAACLSVFTWTTA